MDMAVPALLDATELPASTGDYNKDKIIELLGAGISAVQVASACSVDESYISQLLSDDAINARVQALRVARASKYVEHDDSIETAEKNALALIARNLENSFTLKPMEVLKHFQVLNAARKKTDGSSNAAVPQSTVVTLHIPAAAAVQFKMTTDKQVVEIEGRSMNTMPASAVNKLLRERKAKAQLLESLGAPMVIDTPNILDTL